MKKKISLLLENIIAFVNLFFISFSAFILDSGYICPKLLKKDSLIYILNLEK